MKEVFLSTLIPCTSIAFVRRRGSDQVSKATQEQEAVKSKMSSGSNTKSDSVDEGHFGKLDTLLYHLKIAL